MDIWVWYVLAGLAAGVLSSMFGVGAGILLVPLFSIAFGFGQKDAQGMALAVMVPMALAGAIRYHLNPDIHLNLSVAGIVAIGGVLGAIIGSQIVFGMSNLMLKRLFACFIIVVGIHILVQSFMNHPAKAAPNAEHQTE